MKWQNIVTIVGFLGLGWLGLAVMPAFAQTSSPTGLNGELSQAVCQQDWARAIRVIDRMRAITPADRRGELTVYRSRLQAILNSGTPIPNWQCGSGSVAPVATPRPSPSVATNPSPSNSSNIIDRARNLNQTINNP